MIFSRTSQYAIQALIYLATQPSGRRVLNREIAQNLGVPSAYLAKILQGLSREKLLHSSRGRCGGFSLRPGAGKTSLLDIVLLTEGARVDRECLLGLKVCKDETACPLHRKWKPVKKVIRQSWQRNPDPSCACCSKRPIPFGRSAACAVPALKHSLLACPLRDSVFWICRVCNKRKRDFCKLKT